MTKRYNHKVSYRYIHYKLDPHDRNASIECACTQSRNTDH